MLPKKVRMDARGTSRALGLIAFVAMLPLSLALVGGFFGSFHPAFDSLAHFRIHCAAALILLAPFLLITRGLRWNGLLAAVLGVWAILNITGIAIIPGLGTVQASQEPKDGLAPVYRLMQINLRFNNPEPGKVLSLIGRIRPDVLTLEEVSPMWTEKLALLESAYPYRLACKLDGYVGGVSILSLRPFAEGAEGQCLADGAFASAPIDFGGRLVDVAVMHLHWPWPFDQMNQIKDLTPSLAGLAGSAILAGDLNAVPWSAASARVAEAAGMKAIGPMRPTWLYRRLPEFLRFAGLPIDRVFAREVAVLSVETLEAVGSDHLPVLVHFSPVPPDGEPGDLKTATAWLPSGPLRNEAIR
ncbi:MAG: endonuclease/exonuclease/phosphatase family protein [Hyphomicrobiales bacterium]|nr:endonuclease/exonuclease/phosphatase family protein [Hyphomicrobiales bacterium]